MRSAASHASATYLASTYDAEPLSSKLLRKEGVKLNKGAALVHLNGVLQLDELLTEEVLAGETQKSLSQRVNQHHHQWLLESANLAMDKARLLSLGLPHAGDWFHVVPSLSLHLKPQDFRFGVLYRQGVPLYRSEGPCVACGSLSDVMGDHAISCGFEGERIARHNYLWNALYHTAVTASLAPSKEDRALLPGWHK